MTQYILMSYEIAKVWVESFISLIWEERQPNPEFWTFFAWEHSVQKDLVTIFLMGSAGIKIGLIHPEVMHMWRLRPQRYNKVRI